MGNKPGDDEKTEPSLELPSLSLPGMGRRKKEKRSNGRRVAGRHPEVVAPDPPPETLWEPEQTRPLPPAQSPSVQPPSAQSPSTQPPSTQPPSAQSRRRTGRSGGTSGVPAMIAAATTGVLVGGIGTGLTYLGLQACEILTGTDSCGGGQGILLLVAILAVMVLVGAGLLKAFRVSDAGSTSLLAVGIVTVVAMVGLLDVVFTVWMFAVIPALGAVAYPLARWVTTRFVEDVESPEPHDVR